MKSVTRALVLTGAIVCVVAGTASAAPWGKPGLWQTSMKMDMGMAMPRISPQQLAQMKKLGIKFPSMDGQAIETKMCMTPQDVSNFDARRYANERSGCKQASMNRTGTHIHTTVVCDGEMKGNGAADVDLIDGSHYATMFSFAGVSHGRPVNMKVSTKAHWLGADCGDVKPFPHHG